MLCGEKAALKIQTFRELPSDNVTLDNSFLFMEQLNIKIIKK
jgi:hypothetical protein